MDWSRLFGEHLTFVARYGFGRTDIFDARIAIEDQLNVDRLFPQVRISSVTNSVIRDTRDDPLDPGKGTFVAVDGELAGRSIGSEVGFGKTLLQGFLYRRLAGPRRVVIAGGARLGLARGLPHEIVRLGDDGQPLYGPDGQPLVDVVTDLPAAERFFAGGDNTVRGFAQDRLGEPATLDRNGLPTGGNALLIFNTEVRVPVWKGLIAAGFVDAGNVFQRVSNLDIARDPRSGRLWRALPVADRPDPGRPGVQDEQADLRQRLEGREDGITHHGGASVLAAWPRNAELTLTPKDEG